MKKILSYVAFCLLILATGSAQARFSLPWSSSPVKRALKLKDGRRVYETVLDRAVGDVSPRKAAQFLKEYLGDMNPALAKEVNNMMEAIASGEAVPPDHFETLATHLEIERISKIPGEGETRSDVNRDAKALLKFLTRDSRDEWVASAVEAGQLIVIPTETASRVARGEGYNGIQEFAEAVLSQGEYKYITVPIIDEERAFLLVTEEGYKTFDERHLDNLRVRIDKLIRKRKMKNIATVIAINASVSVSTFVYIYYYLR